MWKDGTWSNVHVLMVIMYNHVVCFMKCVSGVTIHLTPVGDPLYCNGVVNDEIDIIYLLLTDCTMPSGL